jgi:hypothetical protein
MPESFLKRVIARSAGGAGAQPSLEALAAAVRDLADAQRKQTIQLKKLHDAQKEQDRRWEDAFDRWQKEARETARRERHDELRAADKAQRRSQMMVNDLLRSVKTEHKWRLHFARQLNAVLRTLHLHRIPLAPPFDLIAKRFRLWSQNEEDGILLALFEHAGVTDRRFVEIGSGQSGGNSAFLAYECGWSGVMIDIVPEAIDTLRRRFSHNPGVIGVAAAVSAENVNRLLSDHGFTGEVDLLSLDIDSYDYWVLEALTVVSPRVLVVEYNARLGPERALTVPRDQPLDGTPDAYFGASLAAFDKLARRKGYRLVVCDPMGVNAFFLRNDVAPQVPAVPVAQAYRQAIDRWSLDDEPRAGAAATADAPPFVEV